MEKSMVRIKSIKSLGENMYRREYEAKDLLSFAEFLLLIHNISQDFGKPSRNNTIGYTEIYTHPGHIWPSVMVTVKGSQKAIDCFDSFVSENIEEY